VDEVKVIPPITLAINAVNTNSGSCGTGTATTSYVYDSQRRVTQITNGTGAVTTYTAWDSSGRPTAGTAAGGNALSLVYNDSARTVTTTQTGSQPSVGTLSFDANGAQTSIVLVQNGVTTTTTFTNTSTATVCK
jgi:YD repeat-containing protein